MIQVFGMLRQVRVKLLASIIGAEHLLERAEFLRDLSGGLADLLSADLEIGARCNRECWAIAGDCSDLVPCRPNAWYVGWNGPENLNSVNDAVLLIGH